MHTSPHARNQKPKFESLPAEFDCPISQDGAGADPHPRRLMAVGTHGNGRSELKDYAVQLGGRLGYEVVLLTVAASPNLRAHEPAGDLPLGLGGSARSANGLEKIFIECRATLADVSGAVDRLCREIKRIEFILTDSTVVEDMLSQTAVIPVFRIVADAAPAEGGCNMAATPATVHKKPVGKTVVLGILTAALYAAAFWKPDALMKFLTRGGLHAVPTIATAIIFSFVHGAFASNLWSLLGIHPRTRTADYKTVSPGAPSPKIKPKRPRAYAYVNPFHNIELKQK